MTTAPGPKVPAARLLDVIEKDVLPLTEKRVAAGNKVFGAAILRKSDLSVVIAETNNELESPLWHGEVHTLKRFYELKTGLPSSELIFLSTHEPCSMCMSAITWAGFDNIYSFFSHEDVKDGFIPHDAKIFKEVFKLEPGEYRRHNAFWDSYLISEMISNEAEPQQEVLKAQAAQLKKKYEILSNSYHLNKNGNGIPLN